MSVSSYCNCSHLSGQEAGGPGIVDSSHAEDGLDTAETWERWQGQNPPGGWEGQPFLSKRYRILPKTEPTHYA